MIKEEKIIEIAVKTILNSHIEKYSKDFLISTEILNQIKEKGYVYDYKKFSLDDQEIASEIAYRISSNKELTDLEEPGDWIEEDDCLVDDDKIDEELGELYCGEDDEIIFDNVEDLFIVENKWDSLYEILSVLNIPKIIVGKLAYCYNGQYYKIEDIGVDNTVVSISKIEKEDLDQVYIELLVYLSIEN